jgi:hypothetical protein
MSETHKSYKSAALVAIKTSAPGAVVKMEIQSRLREGDGAVSTFFVRWHKETVHFSVFTEDAVVPVVEFFNDSACRDREHHHVESDSVAVREKINTEDFRDRRYAQYGV